MAALHPYYSLLPSYVATDSVLREREDFVGRAQETLRVLQQLRNGATTNVLQKRHFRHVETLFKLKHALPTALHRQLIEELVWHVWQNGAACLVDVELEVRAVRALRLLLKKWKSKVPSREAAALALDWRAAKAAIDRVCFSTPGQSRGANPATLQLLAAAMVSCVEKARPWFSADADGATSLVDALWVQFGAQINDVRSTQCFRALGYFTILLNIPAGAADREWQAIRALVPQWLESWSRIARCADWDGHWFKLFARIGKRFPMELAATLQDALPFIFAKVHDLLNLPSDLGSPFKNNARPSTYSILDGTKRYDQVAMRLCASLLANPRDDGSPAVANQYIVEIVTTLKPYFHPSNASSAAGSLINTVYFLSSAIAQRLGAERAATVLLKVESCHEIFESLLQLAFYGIYSKNRSVASRCMYVIKSLICVDPSYCARPVLEEMVKALDPSALSQSHMAPAAISSLSVFLYHLMCGQHPNGSGLLFSTYLAPLLRLTLPGIDVNDDTKTVTTLRFYFHVLSWLPLVNDVEKKTGDDALRRVEASNVLFKEMEASVFAPIIPNGSDIDRKMWELGSFVEEWSLALLNRCLDFLRTRANTQSHGTTSKSSTDSSRGQREDQVVLEVLNMMGLLYTQMSPSLYSQALRKTVEFVSNSFFTSEFGGKAISSLVANCLQGNLQEALPLFVRLALDKLHVSKSSSLMTNEKVWYLHILIGAVRANDSSPTTLISFRQELRTTLAHYLIQEDDKEVYEAAGRVLEELLHALMGVYPVDFRSLPPQEWETATSPSTSMFQFLGVAVPWQRLNIQWHEPNEEELAFSLELLQDHLLDTFESLQKLRTDGDVGVRQWIPHLKRVYASVRGARNVFVDKASGESALQTGSLPLLERSCGQNAKLLNALVSLKSRVMSETHAIIGHWRAHGTRGVTENQIWKVLLKVMKQLLVWRGSHIGNHRSKEKQNMYIKMMTTDVASKVLRKARRFEQEPLDVAPLSSRNEMVERVLFFYSKRKVQEHFETAQFVLDLEPEATLRKQYEDLLVDVDELTKHMYEEVRNGASAVMRDSYELFARWIYSRIPDHLDILEGKVADENGHVKEEMVSGALDFLRRSLVLSYLWKSRGILLERALKAVLGSNDLVVKKLDSEASKAKVGLQIQAFSLSLLASWRYVRELPSTKLLATLISSEPSQSEHWKHQLMHLVCFFPLLQRQEVPLPISLWQLIIKRLEHDVLPVRQVAVLLLSQLVKLEKWHKKSQGSSDAQLDALIFNDSTLKILITCMVDNQRNTHRFSASADGQHANSAPSDWSFGVNEVIRNLSNTGNAYPKPPPLSSIRLLNQTTDSFKNIELTHVRLVQRLTRMNPDAITQGCVFPTLEGLTSKIDSKVSDEDRQASLSVLAEWSSGMLRAALKLSNDDDELARSIVSSVTGLLKKVLPNLNLAVVEPWTQVLFYACRPSNSSPDQFQLSRLEEVVLYVLKEFEESFARATVDDYADQVKWLSLIEPLLVQILGVDNKRETKIGAAIQDSVVSVVKKHALAHRYKMVRDHAAKTLFVLDASTSTLSESSTSTALLDQLVALTHVSSGEASSNSNEEVDTEDTLSAKETAMQWLVCADRHGETSDFLRVMKSLLPITFVAQSHSKVDIALLAKNTANAISLSLRLHAPPSDVAASGHLADLCGILEHLGAHSSWKTRGAVLRFLTLFTFYHWIFFSSEQQERVQTLIMKFLADEQREIQDMAKYALRSLAHIQRPVAVGALSRQLTEQAQESRIKHPKLIRRLQKQEQDQPGDADELEKTRSRIKTNEQKMATSILGMSAIVLAFPYSVPDFVPPLFEEMGRYLYIKHSTPTVSYLETSVKDTLLEFKRSHQDNWLEIKAHFSPQQRDVFEDVVISPSYYT